MQLNGKLNCVDLLMCLDVRYIVYHYNAEYIQKENLSTTTAAVAPTTVTATWKTRI